MCVVGYGAVVFVTCLVALPSSTCLAFSPNSNVLIVSGTFSSSGLMFTNMHACRAYRDTTVTHWYCWVVLQGPWSYITGGVELYYRGPGAILQGAWSYITGAVELYYRGPVQ